LTVDYKIRIENGGVTITQHVETTASSSNSTQPQAVAGQLNILATSFAGSKAAKAAAQAGTPPGPLIGGTPLGPLIGGTPPGPLIGGTPPGPLIGRGAPEAGPDTASGQITIFGPVVIDATGLLHRCQTSQAFQEKHKEL
jgi:hypothetical protein